MSVINDIKSRIFDMEYGEIILTSDFTDLARITTIRKCLGRCCDDGIIKRVFDGVYEKPKYSSLLKEYLPADPDKVAYALARNYHWSIAPCGDVALNKLGLTTQVPATWAYVSDGPYRKFAWNNTKLKFKHKANREISQLSEKTVMVIEAIRALGKSRIDDSIVAWLRKNLTKEERTLIMSEASNCSEWIYEVIRKVCVDEKGCKVEQ